MSVLILLQAPCKSLMSGIFPDDWKCARVTKLLSRASHLNNYRPISTISVISVVAKAFERIVYDQLYNSLNREKSISKQQSGFRSLHSTVTAHLEATDGWAFNIDCGYVNAVVFLDLKEQYPVIRHAPNYDVWTGCREIKRCEESKRTLKNPFVSRLVDFNTILKLLRITDQ